MKWMTRIPRSFDAHTAHILQYFNPWFQGSCNLIVSVSIRLTGLRATFTLHLLCKWRAWIRRTLWNAQRSVHPHPHWNKLLCSVFQCVISPFAQPEVRSYRSCALTAIQEADEKGQERPHSFCILPVNFKLHLKEEEGCNGKMQFTRNLRASSAQQHVSCCVIYYTFYNNT